MQTLISSSHSNNLKLPLNTIPQQVVPFQKTWLNP